MIQVLENASTASAAIIHKSEISLFEALVGDGYSVSNHTLDSALAKREELMSNHSVFCSDEVSDQIANKIYGGMPKGLIIEQMIKAHA